MWSCIVYQTGSTENKADHVFIKCVTSRLASIVHACMLIKINLFKMCHGRQYRNIFLTVLYRKTNWYALQLWCVPMAASVCSISRSQKLATFECWKCLRASYTAHFKGGKEIPTVMWIVVPCLRYACGQWLRPAEKTARLNINGTLRYGFLVFNKLKL